MDKYNEKILQYIVATIGALAFGIVAYYYAKSSGADNFILAVFFVGGLAVAILSFLLIKIIVKWLSDWILNCILAERFHKNREKRLESECLSTPQVEEYINVKSPEEITIPNPNQEKIKENSEQNKTKIEPDEIFKLKMFGKFEILERRLIADKYLSTDLCWIAKHDNGRIDKKRLICFIAGLIDSNYFMPGRDSMIRNNFELRYKISLGQNFEPARREQFITEYKIEFFNYPF